MSGAAHWHDVDARIVSTPHATRVEAQRTPAWRALGAQAVQRLMTLALTLALTVLFSATMVRYAPGYGLDERMLDARLSEASMLAMEREATTHSSVLAYAAHFTTNLFQGNWGRSVTLSQDVRALIVERAPLTLRSVGMGLGAAWLIAIALAFVLDLLERRGADALATLGAGTLLCVPAAVVALLAMYVELGPALAIALVLLPRLFTQLRALTRSVAARPHVVAARARGVHGLRLVAVHIWWPAASEICALAGVSVNMALGAAIPIETICDAPGLGQLTWQAAMGRDLALLVHLTVLAATLTCVANLIADAARGMTRGGATCAA